MVPRHGMDLKDKPLLSVKECFSPSAKQEARFLCCFGQQDVEVLFSILFSF